MRHTNSQLIEIIREYTENARQARERDMQGSAGLFELIANLAAELLELRHRHDPMRPTIVTEGGGGNGDD